MPLTLSELKEREKVLYPNKGVDKMEVMDAMQDEGKHKMCTKCGVTKTLNHFKPEKRNSKDGCTALCKDCLTVVNLESMEKKALVLYDSKLDYLRKKGRVSVHMMWQQVDYAKSSVSQHLKILAEKGLLNVETENRRKWYSLPQKEDKEDKGVFDFNVKTGHDKGVKNGSYDDIADALPEPKPNFEIKTNAEPIIKQLEERREKLEEVAKEVNNNIIKALGINEETFAKRVENAMNKIGVKEETAIGKPYDEPITPKDMMELERIGITAKEPETINYIGKPTVRDHIVNLVGTAYWDAQSIEINPQTHEIHIKLKEV